MPKKGLLLFTIGLFIFMSFNKEAFGQRTDAFPDYYSQADFQYAPMSTMKSGLNGFNNPALLNFSEGFNTQLMLKPSLDDDLDHTYDSWGGYIGLSNFGVGLSGQRLPNDGSVLDINYSYAFGNDEFALGFSYGRNTGDAFLANRAESNFTIGFISRPSPYFTFGVMNRSYAYGQPSQTTTELGIRPMGDEKITLFGDLSYMSIDDENFYDWSAGIGFEVLPGLRLTGRYIDADFESINAGLVMNFGNVGTYHGNEFTDNNSSDYAPTVGLRVGSWDRSMGDWIYEEDPQYLQMDMSGPIRNQPFRFFDRSQSLQETLDGIEAAREDDDIEGIAINMAGMRARKSMFWEIRNELEALKEEGKKVVIYFDRIGSMDSYHLASVADHLVMHPQGSLTLPGYVLGGTYYRNALDSLGVGVDEFRINEFKSGLEAVSRTGMSEADSIQKDRLVEDFYNTAGDDITASRNIDRERFDSIVNDKTFILPDKAQEFGLIDTVGLWEDSGDWIEEIVGERRAMTSKGDLDRYKETKDDYWGKKPEIAVIYAEGVVAENTGMNTRQIAGEISSAASDDNVEAIVVRVNTPGGDPVAAEIMGKEIREASEQKPLIISQGSVAASGGYWVSMDADTIIAAPGTVTGSIGVAGGWFYDDGLKDNLNLNTDHVQEGKSADLNMTFNIPLPLMNISLPVREMTEDERANRVGRMESLYDDFIEKVAEGRDIEKDSVDKLAQGRVWTGNDAKERGLVDEVGSIQSAINVARQEAGLDKEDPHTIEEYPERPLPNFARLLPAPIFGVLEDYGIFEQEKEQQNLLEAYWELVEEHNGDPILMSPYHYWDFTDDIE